MATAWDEINGRALANLGQVPHSTGLSATSDEPLKPTRGHMACIAELSLRFPAARDTDSRQYQARLDFLASDTAHLAVPLLRAACDRVAQTAKGLPYASEIITAATAIIEERQRAQVSADRGALGGVQIGDKAAAYHCANAACLAKGMKVMQTDDGELFKLGDKGERRGIRPDGSAIVPFFRHEGEVEGVPAGWYVRQEDAATLTRCFQQYEADFHLAGARVLRNAV